MDGLFGQETEGILRYAGDNLLDGWLYNGVSYAA